MEKHNLFYRAYNKFYLRPQKKRKKAQKRNISDFSIQELERAIIGNPANYAAYRAYLDKVSEHTPELLQTLCDVKKRANTFCAFIGHPRSGHSLVGSLIDAHPDAIIAQEVNAFKAFADKTGREEICDFISVNSRLFGTNGRLWGVYDYHVQNQHQGSYKNLKIVGDKKGDGTVDEVKKNPDLLPLFLKTFDYRVKFINVIRNPYDNITSISKANRVSLASAADLFFDRSDTLHWIRRYVGERLSLDHVHDIKSEDLVSDPRNEIKRVCDFLGLTAHEDFLEDTSSVIFKEAKTPRKTVEWSDFLKDVVSYRMEKYDYLKGYTF